jgi:hypothetical protein
MQERLAESSPLERYFHRPGNPEYEGLTCTGYFLKYQVSTEDRGDPDSCAQPRNIVPRRKEALYVLREVFPHDQERFALRVLLSHFAARSSEELRTVNGSCIQHFWKPLGHTDCYWTETMRLESPPDWYVKCVNHPASSDFCWP